VPVPLAVPVPSEVPIDLTREEARRLAELELADPAYRAAQPGLIQRAIDWIVEQVQQLVARVSEAAPGGWWGVLGLVVLVVLGILFARWRIGPVASAATLRFTVDPATSAREFRARAEQAAHAGDWARAVNERMRALVRGCQEHGLIDDRPGWTADEVAAEVGHRLPGAQELLRAGARVFDDVRYGGRPATAASYEAITRADEHVAVGSGAPR
jgi:hypothetical protein